MNVWVMAWIAYGIAWLSTALAISVGIYYTHNAWCLLALFIPLFISITSEKI